jgi:hypothetical protein
MTHRRLFVGAMLALVVAAVGLLLFVVERTAGPVPVAQVPPDAEFLVAAGDSTWWVRSGRDGIRVRSAPILLTEADGRFHEVFLTEEAHDYVGAAFVANRLWARDVLGEDSLLLLDEGTVAREHEAWRRAHPGERPVTPDDEEALEDPPTSVVDELEIVDVHGPWVTWAQALDVDVERRRDHLHRRRRGVRDVRTGRPASLADLFGADEAARAAAAGRAAFDAMLDSIAASTDARGAAAREALGGFTFDTLSFALTDVDRAPAVAFLVPGTAPDGNALALPLRPIPVAEPAWWPPVRATLPEWAPDSASLEWRRGPYLVRARPTSDGESLVLSLVADPEGGGQARAREWPIATVPVPAYQLVGLDAPAVPAPVRAALARAFDRATAVGGTAQRAAWRPPGAARNRATGGG